jgi:hypothetical protein
MNKKLGEAMKVCTYHNEPDLAENIWGDICRRDKKSARIKLATFSLLGIASTVALVPAATMLSSDFTKSGFYEYFSLAIHNTSSISSYWQEILYSLGESLPVASIILSLTLVFVLIVSIKNGTKEIYRSQFIIKTY